MKSKLPGNSKPSASPRSTNISSLLGQAVAFHRAGLLAEAEFEPAFLADQKGRYLPPFMVTAWGHRAPG